MSKILRTVFSALIAVSPLIAVSGADAQGMQRNRGTNQSRPGFGPGNSINQGGGAFARGRINQGGGNPINQGGVGPFGPGGGRGPIPGQGQFTSGPLGGYCSTAVGMFRLQVLSPVDAPCTVPWRGQYYNGSVAAAAQ